MSLYSEFSSLLPYLQSVRKLKNYLSFDVSFPETWKIPKKFVQEDKVMEQQSNVENHRLISFVSEINETEIEQTRNNIQNIVNYNIEREEKEKLLENKIDELKVLFEKNSLNSLKTLKLDLKVPKVKVKEDEQEFKGAKLVDE
jgi:hypothetical protein